MGEGVKRLWGRVLGVGREGSGTTAFLTKALVGKGVGEVVEEGGHGKRGRVWRGCGRQRWEGYVRGCREVSG